MKKVCSCLFTMLLCPADPSCHLSILLERNWMGVDPNEQDAFTCSSSANSLKQTELPTSCTPSEAILSQCCVTSVKGKSLGIGVTGPPGPILVLPNLTGFARYHT